MKHITQATTETSSTQFDQDFKPKGAIAFFILLCLLGSLIYFGIYLVMLDRI